LNETGREESGEAEHPISRVPMVERSSLI
jgi:hypothetical protein